MRTRHAAIALALLLWASPAFADDLRGRVVIDADRDGAAWYVQSWPEARFPLAAPDDALRLMRAGIGISEADIARVPTDAPDGDALAGRLAGRFLLEPEAGGAAWYVSPDGVRHALGDPANALGVLRGLGEPLSTDALDAVPVASPLRPIVSVAAAVPFTAQAPRGNWKDRRQQEGCEEASALMAMAWADGKTSLAPADAEREIRAMAAYEKAHWGSHEDTSAEDTADRIFRGWFGYDGVEVGEDVRADDIVRVVEDGDLAVVPVNGRLLGNPRFTPPGPLRHMIVVTGYDAVADAFIVNEPGTRAGAAWRYPRSVIEAALMDYPSGYHEPLFSPARTAMIVVRPRAKE
jgi:hypothetical protein